MKRRERREFWGDAILVAGLAAIIVAMIVCGTLLELGGKDATGIWIVLGMIALAVML